MDQKVEQKIIAWKNCSAINGGKVTKQVVTWVWIRSSLPKRVWRKCIDFTITNKNGKEEKYRLDEETGLREKVGDNILYYVYNTVKTRMIYRVHDSTILNTFVCSFVYLVTTRLNETFPRLLFGGI